MLAHLFHDMASASNAPLHRLTASLRVAWVAALMVAGLLMRTDSSAPMSPRMQGLPRLILWAWERPEDLRTIDPAAVAVAYLDRTVRILADGEVTIAPRMQLVVIPAQVSRIAVVRIEVQPGATLSPEITTRALAALLDSTSQTGVAAFQVDFDATRSQRAFYRSLLIDLRHRMPADLPLSMTALASWCSWDDWISDLPVDEAVPMFFRMEPDRLRGAANRSEYRVRERLCLGSVGVSTREPWPRQDVSGKRIYLFPDRGWRLDSELLPTETSWTRCR